MKTDTYAKDQERTATKLVEMLTENTGKHFLDSGGAYGRHWERNQGLTVEHFKALPAVTWERDWGATIGVFHFLNDRLTYSKPAEVLTRLMHVWELADYDNRNLYSTGDQENYLEHLGAEVVGDYWNTYNWDNDLSQTLQGLDFNLGDRSFTLMQVHGGCDVRGGYTMPVIFEITCPYWLHGCATYCLECLGCSKFWSVSHGELFNEDGDYLGTIYQDGNEVAKGCPACNGDLKAWGDECC